jgi:hypothetical protein
LTGIRQGKSGQRIKFLTQNQWFAGVVQWQNGSFPSCEGDSVRTRNRLIAVRLPRTIELLIERDAEDAAPAKKPKKP